MKKWELKQTRQCETCPWRESAVVANIPNYDRSLHKDLNETIASPGVLAATATDGSALKVMACHYSSQGDERHCIGWLHNQLGRGNNIPLRIAMRYCINVGVIKLNGEQKQRFEDTFC